MGTASVCCRPLPLQCLRNGSAQLVARADRLRLRLSFNVSHLMNPRRVHDLMRQSFPPVDLVAHDWINVCEVTGLSISRFQDLLDRHISADHLLVEVHRKLGAFLSRQEAIDFVAAHAGQGQIRITDREFKSFVVLAINGVAAGWRRDG